MKQSSRVGVASHFWAAMLGVGLLGSARPVHASPNYPPLLQKALKEALQNCTPGSAGAMACTTPDICVPGCTACHLTNNGGARTMNPWGHYLELYAHLGPQGSDGMDRVSGTAGPVVTYFKTTPPATAKQTMDHEWDADGDGISDRAEILGGDSPSLPAPRGQDQFCPDIRFGCAGGRIAAAPARNDKPAWFAAGLVVVGLGAAMRRRARRAQRAG